MVQFLSRSKTNNFYCFFSEPAADGSGSEEEKTGKIGTKKAKKLAAKAEKKEQREVFFN